MDSVSAILINLDDRVQRLESADGQLKAQGIDYVRLSATDGRGRAASSFPNYSDVLAKCMLGRSLSGSELGCYESHLSALRQFLESDSSTLLVLEDDILVAPNAREVIETLVTALPRDFPDWEVVNLGKAPKKLSRPAADIEGIKLLHAYYFPLTMHALLWSRKGARNFIQSRSKMYLEVDRALIHHLVRRGTGLALDDPVFDQAGQDSDIDGDESTRVVRYNRASAIPRGLAGFMRSSYCKFHASKNILLRSGQLSGGREQELHGRKFRSDRP